MAAINILCQFVWVERAFAYINGSFVRKNHVDFGIYTI